MCSVWWTQRFVDGLCYRFHMSGGLLFLKTPLEPSVPRRSCLATYCVRTLNVLVCCCCVGSDRVAGVRGMQYFNFRILRCLAMSTSRQVRGHK